MKTKNIPLIIGIALPILFIIVISAVVFLPSLTVRPAYNFVYSNVNNYDNVYGQGYKTAYKVENNRIVSEVLPPNKDQKYLGEAPTLFLYDVKQDTSHQISFAEAQNFIVDAGPSSPDGYTVTYQYQNGGLFELFGGSGDNNRYVISKGGAAKKLNGLASGQYWYQGNFKLIGWVK